jgi:hypothetical protein
MNKLSTMMWVVGLAGCAGAPAPERVTAPGVAHPGGAATAATPTPIATPAASTAAPVSPFHVIGELPMEAQLFGVGERGFVASLGGIAFSLIGDDVIHDPLLQRGFNDGAMFQIDGITGRWPDGAWLATVHPAGRTGYSKLWQWDGKRWAYKQSTDESFVIHSIRPWIGGRQLAVEQAGMMFDARFRIVSGDKKIAVPTFTKLPKPLGFCATELQVRAFETFPSGEILAVGQRCDADGVVGLGVERWAPGATKGVLETLPQTNVSNDGRTYCTPNGMVARSPTDVWVSAQKELSSAEDRKRETYLAHFDGTTWKTIETNLPSAIASLTLGGDGALFATTENRELFTGKSPSTFVPVPFPAVLATSATRLEVESFWSRAPGDLWAIVATTQGSGNHNRKTLRRHLVHTRPASGPLPTAEQFEQKERAYRVPGPPVDWCETPFVLLYTLGKNTPADYDYPSTRSALKGHREFLVPGVEFVEFERTGQRFFGARMPDFSLGKRLAALVKEKVPGSTPELVCHNPAAIRTLAIDLATGEVRR